MPSLPKSSQIAVGLSVATAGLVEVVGSAWEIKASLKVKGAGGEGVGIPPVRVPMGRATKKANQVEIG